MLMFVRREGRNKAAYKKYKQT